MIDLFYYFLCHSYLIALVEFGKYYSENIQYEQEEVDKPPTVKAAE